MSGPKRSSGHSFSARLAHGISVGTEIEYADALSLARALQNRVDVARAPEAP